MTKSLANFYKHNAISNFLIGMYCKDSDRYKHKHNELIQRCIEKSSKESNNKLTTIARVQEAIN